MIFISLYFQTWKLPVKSAIFLHSFSFRFVYPKVPESTNIATSFRRQKRHVAMGLLLITSVVKPKLIVIWKLFISAIFLNCFVFLIYLLLINYGKTKSKHRLEIFATDCWKQWWTCKTLKRWGCLGYSQEFAFMPLHKLSVYLKLLHNAAISKQIVKGPAFEVDVNGSS